MVCTYCAHVVESGAQFCSGCGRPLAVYTAPAPRASLALYRPREGRMIAGVCAGFALRFGWDVALVRLVLVLALVFGAGTPFLAYLIAWIVMPNGQYALPMQTGYYAPPAVSAQPVTSATHAERLGAG